MRMLTYVAAAVGLAASVHVRPEGQALVVSQVLADTRQALGGEAKLSAVKTFVATGRTRQLRGNNLVPIVFEINCELPDRFVRIDEFPAQDTDPTTQGFNGEELIQFPALPAGRGGPPEGGRGGPPPDAGRAAPPPDAGRGGPPPEGARRGGDPGRGAMPARSPAQQRVLTLKQDFARLTLGMFAASFPSYPLTFKYVGEGDAPEGKADILEVTGPGNFAVRLVVQRQTHLPVMLMWQTPATNVVFKNPGQELPNPPPPGSLVVEAPPAPAATATAEERDKYTASLAALRRQTLAQAKPIEYRVYYGDVRDVDGMKWPFRIRRSIAGETVEEMTFDRFRINAKIDPRKFESPKS